MLQYLEEHGTAASRTQIESFVEAVKVHDIRVRPSARIMLCECQHCFDPVCNIHLACKSLQPLGLLKSELLQLIDLKPAALVDVHLVRPSVNWAHKLSK